MEDKVIPFDKIGALVEKLRKKPSPPVIALCHGCFDIVHPGHIRHLKFAREQGDFLAISITPDSCVQKGASRPYVPQDLRAENLAAQISKIAAIESAPGESVAIATQLATYTELFGLLFWIGLGVGAVMIVISPLLRRGMHGVN